MNLSCPQWCSKYFNPCNYCSSKDNVNNKLTMLNIMHLVWHYIILTVKCKICCTAIVNNANFIFGWCAPQYCTLHPINFVNPHPMCHVENDCLHKRNTFIFVLGASISQIGSVTNCPGFFCLLVLSHPGLPCSSYAGSTGVQYSTRHLPVSAKHVHL